MSNHRHRYAAELMSQPFEHEEESSSPGLLRSCFSCTTLLFRLLFCLPGTTPSSPHGRVAESSGALLRYQAPLAPCAGSREQPGPSREQPQQQQCLTARHRHQHQGAAGAAPPGENERLNLLPKGTRGSSDPEPASPAAVAATPLPTKQGLEVPPGSAGGGRRPSGKGDDSAAASADASCCSGVGPDQLLLRELETARARVLRKLGSGLSLSDLDVDVCPTCLDPYTEENPKIHTQCHHHFHLACIYEWLERSKTCPMCGRDMEFEGFCD